jgi:branched-chain amino acid transport system permease protein
VPSALDQLPQQLWNGISVGAVYALIALGYTMVYGILELINFAHGEIFMIGAYLGVVFLSLTLPLGLPLGISVVLALLAAMAVTACFGYTLERGAYRPLRHAPRLSPLISALGASIGLQQLVMLLQGTRPAVPPRELPSQTWSSFVTISRIDAFIVATAVILMLGLHLFIRRTRLGKAMRATAQDQTMASLLGISIDRVISATFLIGSALAAVAGVLTVLKYGKVDYVAGYVAGLKAFTAAVLGGIGNIPGAMLGGILLGVVESIGAGFIGGEYKDLFAFAILILVLLVKPSGLLGERAADKV